MVTPASYLRCIPFLEVSSASSLPEETLSGGDPIPMPISTVMPDTISLSKGGARGSVPSKLNAAADGHAGQSDLLHGTGHSGVQHLSAQLSPSTSPSTVREIPRLMYTVAGMQGKIRELAHSQIEAKAEVSASQRRIEARLETLAVLMLPLLSQSTSPADAS